MPAQILPLIDQVQEQQQNQVVNQRMVQEQQLLGLQQARFQAEQQLQPLRQQLMQAELERTGQAMQQSHDAWLRSKELEPVEDQLNAARIDQAKSNLKRSEQDYELSAQDETRKQGAYDQQTALQDAQLKQAVEQLKRAPFETMRDAADFQLRQKLGQDTLDQNQRQLVTDQATNLTLLTTLPLAQRKVALQPYVEHGLVSQEMAKTIMLAPDTTKDLIATARAQKGEEFATVLQGLLKRRDQQPTEFEAAIEAKGGVSGRMQAGEEVAKMVRQLDDAGPESLMELPLLPDGRVDKSKLEYKRVYNTPQGPARYIGNGQMMKLRGGSNPVTDVK